MDPEKFLRCQAMHRLQHNKLKKITRLPKKKIDDCIEYAVRIWNQGNASAEVVLREMETYAKSMTEKIP